MDAFETLVRLFYEGVRCDEVLWPIYDQNDLGGVIATQPLSWPASGLLVSPATSSRRRARLRCWLWSGRRESNPRIQLGKLTLYH
ncbi:hypothetical protein PPA2072 [Cutibacterium acnes KPA171202]|uniref:Uncharacterized protein n=1 Tax=Cutibacterium acnes (strain DSM 16379 / KPA171202) TaxID=267747 RepID=Q6A630_CUTAK|nr:hypothetical protein PPA2072 [Cutibacterium acnes KPA171202]